MFARVRVSLALVSLAAAAALAGCGDDPAPSFEVTLSISDTTLPADGSDTASLTVIVVDSSGKTELLGETVPVQCQDRDGNAAGVLERSEDTGRALAMLDGLGIDILTFRCHEERGADYQVQCIAVYERATGILPPFTCVSMGPAS